MKANKLCTACKASLFVMLGAFAAGAAAQQSESVVEFDPGYGVGDTERLTIDAGEVVYLEKGEGSPVVFYYPGFDQRYWQWQVEAAAAAGYRAIAISFAPPSADVQSPPPSADAEDDLFGVAALAAALDELGLGPVHFVAHSIAAWQAMALASVRPELFGTLVLEEPAVELTDAPMPECSLAEASEDERAACQFASLHSNAGWFERQSAALRGYLSEGFGALLQDDPREIEFPSICEDVARLPMPILFIRGADTPAYFQASLDGHEDCLPEPEVLTVGGAAHMVHMDQPEAHNRAVLDFIGRHED
jgi:pimeloyl-ACP methyl ester carboxylesterase